MKKLVWIAAAMVLMMTVCVACAETASEPVPTLVPVLELPELETGTITERTLEEDVTENPNPPRDDCYIYDDAESEIPTGYADPSITVNIGRGRIYETDYVYARIKIASPMQMRTMLASPLSSKSTKAAADLAKRVQSVIAINGDWCGGNEYFKGAILRQGKTLRMKASGDLDVLVVDMEGNFHILKTATNEDVEPWVENAAQIFTFGPGLVIDGEPQYGIVLGKIASRKAAQRMAICQTGELEYMVITSEGPEDPGSAGLNLDQFVELVASFPDVKNAYNLDGGSSSTVVFKKGNSNWEKINCPNNTKVRWVKDIIYFVSTYEHEVQ